MAGIPGTPPASGGAETAVRRIADDRVETRPQEQAVYIDGIPDEEIRGLSFELLDMVAVRAGSIVPVREICEELLGNYNDSTKASLAAVINTLQDRLGSELGDPESGALRQRPRYGIWAAKTLAHTGIIPPVEADSPARVLADSRLAVYPDQAVIIKDGEIMEDLTPSEYGLVAELARRPGRVVNSQVLKEAAGMRGSGTRGLVEHMKNLRRKLGQDDLGHPRQGVIVKRDGGYAGQKALRRS